MGLQDLPTKSHPELKAFVAGWGFDSYGIKKCDTNEFGPSPHSVCSFSFRIGDDTYSGCTKTPSPSGRHPVCQEFFKWAASKKLDLWNGKLSKSYFISYWSRGIRNPKEGKEEEITCYNPSVGNGWCGTCYNFKSRALKPGQDGYCFDGNKNESKY